MNHTLVQDQVDEVLEPSHELGELADMVEQIAPSAHRLPSYHPTAWAFVNQILDVTDRVSAGRAGFLQRVFSYLFFGGSAAIVNLVIFYIIRHYVPLPVNTYLHTLISSAVACEISLIANFIPNDYYTFRHMPGHARSWLARCARFHATALVGSLITIVLQQFFTGVLHIDPPTIGQAIALIIALIYNFTFHHIFTYSHKKKNI